MKNHFFEKFSEYLKEECLPGVWSKGVQMSRAAASIELIAHPADLESAGEWKFKLKTTERLLAYSVTLWPGEEDSHCNCGSKVEPCHHIVAITLAFNNGLVQPSENNDAATKPRLEYQWKIDPHSLQIELVREFKVGDRVLPIPGTLIGLIGGVQSGRIQSPLPATSSLDLKIDEVFSKSVRRTREFLPIVAELPPLKLTAPLQTDKGEITELKIRKTKDRPKLLIDRLDHSFVFRPQIQGEAPLLNLSEGLALFLSSDPNTGELGVASNHGLPPSPKPIDCNDPMALEIFLRETLPTLREHYDIEIRTQDLPELIEIEPILAFRVNPFKNGNVSVTGYIDYPLPPSEKPVIAKRNLEQERALQKKLKAEFNLNLEQPATLTAEAAFQFRQKLNATQTQSRSLDAYLESTLQNLGGLSLDQALAKPSEVLHLLKLKEQNAGNTSGAVKTLAQTLRSSFTGEDFLAIDLKAAEGLPDYLRDYQKQGVGWLRKKAAEHSGAILADDMGLGKTVQTLWAIPTPALIVVPTTLTQNWLNEARQFRPELKINLYHGSDRQFDDSADITLTTYGVLRQDAEKLISKSWAAAVLDEAHLIRNPDTQAAIASFQIRAAFKLALTGTPIQNRPRDLWSLFQFIAPGVFASEAEITPSLIAPFLLRRTKGDVLQELPPKTYLEHWVELQDAEKTSYESALAAAKKEIAERISDSTELSPLTLFETLLRARQTCDHVGLYDSSRWGEESSKLTALFDLLEELTEAGHSVLVFSQWTRFLDRITDQLQNLPPERQLKWFRLDGKTNNRGQVLETFKNATGPRVFLLSLHAGGVGLNLTEADQVVFCDPWWNPFVELQAEDRAYRMGQEKPVTIHRLLCSGTIEERIRELQHEKQKLGNALILKEDLNRLLDK